MGSCCTTSEDPSDRREDDKKQSPNKKQTKPQPEINVFRPGPRDVRIVQDDDGNLKRTKFVHSNPNENTGEAQSLVTHSLMTGQKKEIENRPSS